MQTVRLVRTSGLCILKQLRLEEAFLRADPGSWCLINEGASHTAAVLGLSGVASRMLAPEAASALPVYRRFTGGGTVVVDADTLFVSLIFGQEAVPGTPLFPDQLMDWSERFYARVFSSLPAFRLRENDYVLGERKFGGNAQCITKGRFVHHTSFLWDFDQDTMALLQHPPRTPAYRQSRGHSEFVCRLRQHWPSRSTLGQRVADELARTFSIVEIPLAEAELVLSRQHHCSSSIVSLPEHALAPSSIERQTSRLS